MAAKHSALARDALDHHIALQPGQAALWTNRAKFDVELGDHETALADDDEALAIDKSDVGTWLQCVHELLRLNRGDEAVLSCLTGLDLYDVPFNRSNCAVVEWQAGDHARAIVTLEALLPHREEMEAADQIYWFDDIGEALISYGRAKEAVPFLQSSLKRWPDADYDRLSLYLARALSGDEAAGRAELAARSTEHSRQWPGHLIDYATRRLDDDALRKLATVDAPGNSAGQACEASFYIGLRHWIDGDVAAGKALLARAVNECPRTFTEAKVAQAWLAAGPGAAHEASVTSSANAATR